MKFIMNPVIGCLDSNVCFTINGSNFDEFNQYEGLREKVEAIGMSTHNLHLKKAYGTVGNPFIIGESNKKGYFIYSEEVSDFTEYSLKSKSPYINYDDHLIYGGPGSYFVENASSYNSVLVCYSIEKSKIGLKNDYSSISQVLYNLDKKESTTSMHIKSVMNQYAEKRNIKIDYTSRWTPFFTTNTIVNAIKSDNPVELFGNFSYKDDIHQGNSGNHAMVAYEIGLVSNLSTTQYNLRCHLGWPDYGDVTITSYAIGSLYFFTC